MKALTQLQNHPGKLNLDDEFLVVCGLGYLTKPARKHLLEQIYFELETRVGKRLTEGMSDELLDEFGMFVPEYDDGKPGDVDLEPIQALLNEYFPLSDPDNAGFIQQHYEDALKNCPGITTDDFLKEFLPELGAQLWLTHNRPDYAEVVTSVFDEIRQEILSSPEAGLEKYLVGGIDSIMEDQAVFEDLCEVFNENGYDYHKIEDELTIWLNIKASMHVELLIRVEHNFRHISVRSLLPFSITADSGSALDAALKRVNGSLRYGLFDYLQDEGIIGYKANQSFVERRIAKPQLNKIFKYMIWAVGELSEQVHAFNRGYIDIDELCDYIDKEG